MSITVCCCECEDVLIVEDENGERVFCTRCGNELYVCDESEV